ncbi:MAG: HAMP domain-containing protein, partial [Deltaproteobacteria bacterium]|nr:HAMP domain-containing protein [Deltaproteobacteria bacterium]
MKLNMYPKLLAVFLLVAAIPLFMNGYYFARQLLTVQQESIEKVSRLQLEKVCDQLDARITVIDDSLQLLAREIVEAADPESLMLAIYHQHPEIRSLVHTVGADNQVREAVLRYGFLAPGSSYKPADTGFWHRKVTLSFWNLEPQLSLAYRLFDPVTGNRCGILWAEISLKSFFALVNRHKQAGEVSYVVTMDGKIVSHPDINLVLGGKSIAGLPLMQAVAGRQEPARRAFFYRNLQGVEVLGMVSGIPGVPLLVVREVPRRLIDLPYARMKQQMVTVAVICLFFLVFCSWIFSLLITRPLKRLNNGVSRIISGDYRFSLSGFPRDEIGDLADKFNQMVEKLRT